MFCRVVEDGLMKSRNQRCALAFGCNIPASEIGHGGNAGKFGNYIGIADLQGKRKSDVRRMVNGLAMAADGIDR